MYLNMTSRNCHVMSARLPCHFGSGRLPGVQFSLHDTRLYGNKTTDENQNTVKEVMESADRKRLAEQHAEEQPPELDL